MPENNANDDEIIPIGDVMAHAFRVDCENALLRSLVLLMALNVDAEFMPDAERTLLVSILDGG